MVYGISVGYNRGSERKKTGQASSGCVSSPAELVLEVGERGVNQAAVKVWPLVL